MKWPYKEIRGLPSCLSVYGFSFLMGPITPWTLCFSVPFLRFTSVFSIPFYDFFFLFPVSLQALWSVASWKQGVSLTQNVMFHETGERGRYHNCRK